MYLPTTMLGQSGCRLQFPKSVVYFDPYLSDSVRQLDDPDLQRQTSIPMAPEAIKDASWVLISHDHIDHCDPHTLPKLAKASSNAQFCGPAPVVEKLTAWGIAPSRIHLATEAGLWLDGTLHLQAVPAAHPTVQRDQAGQLNCVGYVLTQGNERLYLAGDTSAHQEVINALQAIGSIHTAFLPVNEHNYFRQRRGIVGNMSVREAFQFAQEIQAKQVVAVHWDMFAINSVIPDEIRLVHQRLKPGFSLLINPSVINLGKAKVSVVIRTLNEAKHLDELLTSIGQQHCPDIHPEVVLVDSGSTDGTLEIAERHGCRILHITREQFSFGRSLNMGCDAAEGDILVITSGHCVPVDQFWLHKLCKPILDGVAQYTYGKQHGGQHSHFSECRIFAKYFPDQSQLPQEGFFCNNANSAIHRDTWAARQFDEELTGLEDMELAQWLVRRGGKVAYVADAGVYHHHSESWAQVRRRFEREAIALQKIMPQLHVGLGDTARYIWTSVIKDLSAVRHAPHPRASPKNIFMYRWNQYIGSWRGNQQHRKLSHAEKDQYFYPH